MIILVIVFLYVSALVVPYRSADTNSSRSVYSSKLTYLDLSGNRIRFLDNSAFRKQGQLETLILSGNMLQSLGSDLFTDCTNLRSLYLSANNITQISTSSFRGLERLEHLDLSKNNIQELDPLAFQNNLTSSLRQTRPVSKLKHLNLAQNEIRSFNFESFSSATFQLENLDISSNRLYSFDAELVISLNRSITHINLTGNPWECKCSWLGACHKKQRGQTLLWPCELANNVTEDRCNALEHLCPDEGAVATTVNPDSITIQSAACIREGVKDTSLVTTLFVVNGVLLVTTVAGGVFAMVQLLKERRKSPRVPQYDDIYVPLVGVETTVRLDSSTDPKTYNETTEHVYETVN
jgi:hypothetical protein